MGVNDPQAELPQVTDQSTPLFDGSFVTTAVRGLIALVNIDDGGGGLKETTGARAIVMFAEANFVGSAAEVAIIFTVLPVGTAGGAVYVVALPLAV